MNDLEIDPFLINQNLTGFEDLKITNPLIKYHCKLSCKFP